MGDDTLKNQEFLWNTIWGTIYKAAIVDAFTGEYEFARENDREKEAGCYDAEGIEAYVDILVEKGFVHPKDVESIKEATRLKNIRESWEMQTVHKVHSYRRKEEDAYIWITFEVLVPQNFSKAEPRVLFVWRKADSDSTAMQDNLKMISTIYYKILKVNLTTDCYEEFKVESDEMHASEGLSTEISKWFHQFALAGYVYELDMEQYLLFTEIHSLRQRFREHEDCAKLVYRRRTGDSFRWVSMEIVPSVEYTDDNQIVMLYVRDIHDSYMEKLHMTRMLEYYQSK